MLDAHPAVAVAPETHFGERFVRKRRTYGVEGAAGSRAALIDAFCASRGFQQMEIDEASVRASLDAAELRGVGGQGPDDPWRPLRAALERLATERGVALVGEKTPSHALHTAALSRAFPGARFILLRRDPRAVVASWRAVRWSQRSPTEAAEIWRRYARAIRRSARVDRAHTLVLDYEKLVIETESTLRRICDFLGIAFDEAMLTYHERPSAVSPEEPHDSLTRAEPTGTRVAAWRAMLDRGDLARTEAICGAEMRRAGYRPEAPLRARLRAGAAVVPGCGASGWGGACAAAISEAVQSSGDCPFRARKSRISHCAMLTLPGK